MYVQKLLKQLKLMHYSFVNQHGFDFKNLLHPNPFS